MQGYCDVYKWTILKRTSPEVKCLHPMSSRREMCTLSVSNVIYHKFSHGAVSTGSMGKTLTSCQNINSVIGSSKMKKQKVMWVFYIKKNTSPVHKMTGHLRNGQNMRVCVIAD